MINKFVIIIMNRRDQFRAGDGAGEIVRDIRNLDNVSHSLDSFEDFGDHFGDSHNLPEATAIIGALVEGLRSYEPRHLIDRSLCHHHEH